jgi:hypothetical protein
MVEMQIITVRIHIQMRKRRKEPRATAVRMASATWKDGNETIAASFRSTSSGALDFRRIKWAVTLI